MSPSSHRSMAFTMPSFQVRALLSSAEETGKKEKRRHPSPADDDAVSGISTNNKDGIVTCDTPDGVTCSETASLTPDTCLVPGPATSAARGRNAVGDLLRSTWRHPIRWMVRSRAVTVVH
ncbi:hypothetical protein BHE74_00051318 [Ensete ventricosum]|nr:hypothetical protein BHE74_00051318 [Ensete ventricosum]RZR96997.1 hypothetical protein BHM03_00026106 [Ensete ventricosum]